MQTLTQNPKTTQIQPLEKGATSKQIMILILSKKLLRTINKKSKISKSLTPVLHLPRDRNLKMIRRVKKNLRRLKKN